jgi:lysophospholipase L1-like esterase
LAALEVGLRLFAPQPLKVSVPTILDEELIYRLPANSKGTDVKAEFAVRIETNSFGVRDRDYPTEKAAGVGQRMLVLGDSMTFAEGVEAEETYPKLLERALAGGNGRHHEVINAAIRGYGTDQELLLFEKLIPIYRPDVVLLGFYAGNDLDDNLYGHLFEVRGSDLVRVPISEESSLKFRYYKHQSYIQSLPMYQTLTAHSHVMNLLRRWWARRVFDQVFVDHERFDHAKEERAWLLTRRLLMAWHERARQQGIRSVLLGIPTREQIYGGKDSVNDARMERVRALADQLGVPLIDPRPTLRAVANGGEPLYYPNDRHFTVAGHRVVADRLKRDLQAMGLLR